MSKHVSKISHDHVAHPVAPHAHILMPFTQSEEDEIGCGGGEEDLDGDADDVDDVDHAHDADAGVRDCDAVMMMLMMMMMMMMMMRMVCLFVCLFVCHGAHVITPQGGCACKKTNYIFSLSNI